MAGVQKQAAKRGRRRLDKGSCSRKKHEDTTDEASMVFVPHRSKGGGGGYTTGRNSSVRGESAVDIGRKQAQRGEKVESRLWDRLGAGFIT